jgi:hypothetical protein
LNTKQATLVQAREENAHDVHSALVVQAPPVVDDSDDDFITITQSKVARCPFCALLSLPLSLAVTWHPCLIHLCLNVFASHSTCLQICVDRRRSALCYRSHTMACTTTRRMLPCKQSYWHQVNRGQGTIQVWCSLD